MIYLDHHATTPLDPRVLERMMPFLTGQFGNASSKHHRYGWFAAEAVEAAREEVAQLLGTTGREIVFTSGATESINIALQGAARAREPTGRHLITQATEHKAVLDVLHAIGGFDVTVLPVDGQGRVDPDEFARAIRPDTILASIMHGNNEVGTLQDLETIGAHCRERGVWLHVDAAQTAGKIPIDLSRLPIDLMSVSGHKMYGPKGVGALFLRRRGPRVSIVPIVHGGGHERGLRSGTLNVPGIVGLGAAATIAQEEMHECSARVRTLRDRLEVMLLDAIPGAVVHGPPDRLYNNLNISFPGVAADALLAKARGIAASSGSACTSASLEPSHVLQAMATAPDRVVGAIRLSPGRGTQEEEIDQAVDILRTTYRSLRA